MRARNTKAIQQEDRTPQYSESINKSKTLYKNFIEYNIMSVVQNANKVESVKKLSSEDNNGNKHFPENTCKDTNNTKPYKCNKTVESDRNGAVKHKSFSSSSNVTTYKLSTEKYRDVEDADKDAVRACRPTTYRGSVRSSDPETSHYSNTCVNVKSSQETGSNKLPVNSSGNSIANLKTRSTRSQQHGLKDLDYISNSKTKNYIVYNIQSVSKNANKVESVRKKSDTSNSTVKNVSENINDLKSVKVNKFKVLNNVNPVCEAARTDKLATKTTEELMSEVKHLLSLKGRNMKLIEPKIKQIAYNILNADEVHKNPNKIAVAFFSLMRNLLEQLITNNLCEDRSPEKITSSVQKTTLPKKEYAFNNGDDSSYYEQYLTEIINTFIQEYKYGSKPFGNKLKSNIGQLETTKKDNNKKENGLKTVDITSPLRNVDTSEDIVDQKTGENESDEKLSTDDLNSKWYKTPSTVELMKEIKDLLQGEAWEMFTKQCDKKYFVLDTNKNTVRNASEQTIKPLTNTKGYVKNNLEQWNTKPLPINGENIPNKVDNVQLNIEKLLSDICKTNTDVYNKRVKSPFKQSSYITSDNNETVSCTNEKNYSDDRKDTTDNAVKQVLSNGSKTLNSETSCLNDGKQFVCTKNITSKNIWTTNKEEKNSVKWTSQKKQWQTTGNTTEHSHSSFSNEANGEGTFIIQDLSESNDSIKQLSSYIDWYQINNGISQHESTSDVKESTVVSNEGIGLLDHPIIYNIPENIQNVSSHVFVKTDTLSGEPNHKRFLKMTEKGNEESSKDTIDERRFEKQERSLMRNEILSDEHTKKENEIKKQKYKEDSESYIRELHSFDLSLQHILNVFLSLNFKLNRLPPDIKFTPILKLNPPETLGKAILMLPVLMENICGVSFTALFQNIAKGGEEENIFYEIENILDVFGNIFKDSSKRRTIISQRISHCNDYLINKEIPSSERRLGVTVVSHEQKADEDPRKMYDVPKDVQNVSIQGSVKTLSFVGENNCRRYINETEKEEEQPKNEAINERTFESIVNKQSLSSFDGSKAVHDSEILDSSDYGMPNSTFNTIKETFNVLTDNDSKHSLHLNLKNMGERKTIDESDGDLNFKHHLIRDKFLKGEENTEQEENDIEHFREDNENKLQQLLAFEISLQHISNMLFSLCVKIYSAPPDIMYTPIMNLNPPETLMKAVLNLPFLTEYIFEVPFTTFLKNYSEKGGIEENICYEIKNMLDVFGNIYKMSMSNDMKQLNNNENVAKLNDSKSVISSFTCLRNTISAGGNLDTRPKMTGSTEFHVSEVSKKLRTSTDNGINTYFTPSNIFIPIAANESSTSNFMFYNNLYFFLLGKGTVMK